MLEPFFDFDIFRVYPVSNDCLFTDAEKLHHFYPLLMVSCKHIYILSNSHHQFQLSSEFPKQAPKA